MRFSNTLTAEQGVAGFQIHCGECKAALGAADGNWKQGAQLVERAADELGGPYQTGRDLLLRQFSCPQCGVLLETELAIQGEPWIEDRLFADPGG